LKAEIIRRPIFNMMYKIYVRVTFGEGSGHKSLSEWLSSLVTNWQTARKWTLQTLQWFRFTALWNSCSILLRRQRQISWSKTPQQAKISQLR